MKRVRFRKTNQRLLLIWIQLLIFHIKKFKRHLKSNLHLQYRNFSMLFYKRLIFKKSIIRNSSNFKTIDLHFANKTPSRFETQPPNRHAPFEIDNANTNHIDVTDAQFLRIFQHKDIAHAHTNQRIGWRPFQVRIAIFFLAVPRRLFNIYRI